MEPINAIYCDIDGPLLPASPDPELPYMKRRQFVDNAIAQYRKSKGYKPLNATLFQRTDTFYENSWSTELGKVTALLLRNESGLDLVRLEEIWRERWSNNWPAAKRIIKDSVDYYFKLVKEHEKKHGELKYTPNPGIREFLEVAKNAGISLYIVSGNPKAIAEDKLKRAGLRDLFLIDGKFPDWPIYGEDVEKRTVAIEYIQACTGKLEGVYLGDRESDLNVGYDRPDIKMIMFREDPTLDPSFHRKFRLARPYLEEISKNGRCLYLPQGLGDKNGINKQEMDKALGFIGIGPMGGLVEMVYGRPLERR